jgi:hypothetical protein
MSVGERSMLSRRPAEPATLTAPDAFEGVVAKTGAHARCAPTTSDGRSTTIACAPPTGESVTVAGWGHGARSS